MFFKRLIRDRSRAPVRAHTRRLLCESLERRDCPSVTSPTGVQLTALAPTQVKVAWTDQASETGYRVLRWDGTQFTTLASLPADTTTYVATGLTAGTQQWFAVEAFDATTTARSNWATVQLSAEPITAPTALVGQATSQTQIVLTWGPATGETGYHVYEWTGSQANQIGATDANTTTFTVNGLSAGTAYYFYVEAYNSSNSAATGWQSMRTQATPVTAPTQLTITATSSTAVNVVWSGATGATGYRVYEWDGSKAVLEGTVAATVSHLAVIGLKPDSSNWFYVEAFNANNSAVTAWKLGLTPTATPLLSPGNFTAKVTGSGVVSLWWNTSALAGGYRVLVYDGSAWTVATTVAAGKTSAVVKGLISGHTYSFAIQAFSNNGLETANSTVVTLKV